MRPSLLFPLFAPLSTLKGVGPALTAALKRLHIERVIDLLWHLPSGIAYFPLKHTLTDCLSGQSIGIVAKIVAYEFPPPRKAQPAKIICEVEGVPLILIFFKAYPKSLKTRFPIGEKRLVCGTVESFLGTWQMVHPERVLFPSAAQNWKEKSPLYPLTAGLFQSQLQKLIPHALSALPALPEWLPPSETRIPWREALRALHNPQQDQELDPESPLRKQLAFDELFADQLALLLVRRAQTPGRSLSLKGVLKEKVLKAFGRPLTSGQSQSLSEIESDLASPQKMIRLLQGDVGSGKTLVAFLAMAQAIDAGVQTALLVPTDVLATQHFETLSPLAEAAGIKIGLLRGRLKQKGEIYEALSSGAIDLVVGTHALLQAPVTFKNLGFVVIDEQHRFGVEQRLYLTAKGKAVDVLVMTATPIPRTLCLTAYGDVDVSRIPDKPLGRKPIQTHLISLARWKEVSARLPHLLEQNQRVYWVCPLVEESEALDLAAAKQRYIELSALLGSEKVGLLYGKQKAEEKEATLAAFRNGKIQVLVATTVIEVGIDVKEANYMIVEHAERFGLSQLHQLRGRVGRGTEEGHCLLLYTPPLSLLAQERLGIMRETEDGFRLAEKDLSLRGAGDVLGVKQSGLPSYRLADPLTCGPLLEEAHGAATALLEEDPYLQSPRGQAARILLALFGQESVVSRFLSG